MNEGYIKFNCRQAGSGVIPGEKLTEINEWRTRLFNMGLIGMYPDDYEVESLRGVGFGNISMRSERGFIISGSATGHDRVLSPGQYAEVLDVDIENNTLTYLGPTKASSESMTHAAVYMSNHQANAVIHVHNLTFWNRILDKVPTTSGDVPYGTPDMAREIMRLMEQHRTRDMKIVCMGGHKEGVLTFGNTLDEAGSTLLSHFGEGS